MKSNILNTLKKPYLLALIILFVTTSCQTGVLVRPAKIDVYDFNPQSLTSLEEYASLAFSSHRLNTDTLLMLTEEYFTDADIELERLAELRDDVSSTPTLNYDKLINIYKKLLTKFKTTPQSDSLYYVLGYSLYDNGNIEDALTYFEELLQRYAKTKFKDEVLFRIGEIKFDLGDFDESISTYNILLSNPNSPYFEKALYKTGWSYYKLEDYKTAIKYFTEIVDRHTIKGVPDFEKDGIAKAAYDNIVSALSHNKDHDSLMAALKGILNKPYSDRLTVDLRIKLLEYSKFEEAITANTILISLFPDSKELPKAYLSLSEIYKHKNDSGKYLSSLRKIIKSYTPDSPWYKNAFKARDYGTDEVVSKTIKEIAWHHFNMAAKENKKHNLDISIEILKKHKRFYSNSARHPEMTLLLAESLFENSQYFEASQNYIASMKLHENTPEGVDSAKAALISLNLNLPYTNINSRNTKVNEMIAGIKDIVVSFPKISPKNKNKNDIYFDSALLFDKLKSYNDAKDTLRLLFQTKDNVKAFTLTGDIFIKEENFLEASNYFASAFEIEPNNQGLVVKLAKSYFMAAKNLSEEKRFEEAAYYYYMTFDIDKSTELGLNALTQKAKIHMDTGAMTDFYTTLKLITTHYATSEKVYSLLIDGGKTFETQGKWVFAANLFSDAARLAKDSTDKEKLYLKAATILENAGLYVDLERIISYPIKKKVFSKKTKTHALYLLGTAQYLGAKSSHSKGRKTLQNIASLKRVSKSDEEYVVKSRFRLTEEKVVKFKAIKIKEPFIETFTSKNALLREIIDDYKFVLKSKRAELIPEVFYRMGVLFEEFAMSMLYSERPSTLFGEELEEYNFQIEQRAYPVEEEAVKAYESSLKSALATDSGYRVMWMKKVMTKLIELKPALYHRNMAELGTMPYLMQSEPIAIY